jgi:tRNA threonylcarbamoyladenosine biosynthesis protein TsaE
LAEQLVRSWKKVFESDLPYVVSELKESLERPSVMILTGDVGAGKTTFVKTFVGSLFPSQQIQSPSYQLIYEYPGILHADFYRIEKYEDLYPIELNLYTENKEFLIIEWGKKWRSFLEKECDERFKFYEVVIELYHHDEHPSRHYHLYALDRQI